MSSEPFDAGRHPDPAQRVRTIHDDVSACEDGICCCEPEPRWEALGEELGIEGDAGDRRP